MSAQAGGWETWDWDESLFAGAAEYYVQGRLPYAPGVEEALGAALELDGTGRLLDIGCGPGTVTLRFAPLFQEVVGLDPDREMLAEARRIAAARGVVNARWECARAEALPAGLGSFRVATFAASFHWMDRPVVASAVRTMLTPGGAAVQVDAPAYRIDDLLAEASRGQLPYPPPPEAELEELRRRYLGPDRRAGRGIRNSSPTGEDAVFQAAGFMPARRIIVPDGRILHRTVDQIVANRFSSSGTAPRLFGERRGSFEADMRRLLRRASPAGLFSVLLPDNILSIWRCP